MLINYYTYEKQKKMYYYSTKKQFSLKNLLGKNANKKKNWNEKKGETKIHLPYCQQDNFKKNLL